MVCQASTSRWGLLPPRSLDSPASFTTFIKAVACVLPSSINSSGVRFSRRSTVAPLCRATAVLLCSLMLSSVLPAP